jgi:hypothetical protein
VPDSEYDWYTAEDEFTVDRRELALFLIFAALCGLILVILFI